MDIKAFRGFSGTYNVRANERDSGPTQNIECIVQFLNNTQQKFIIDRRCKGQTLLDRVFKHLNLIETDFFGLKFIPHEQYCLTEHKTNHAPVNAQSFTTCDENPSTLSSLASSSTTDKNDCHISRSHTSKQSNDSAEPVSIDETKSSKDSHVYSENHGLETYQRNTKLAKFLWERWLDPAKSIKKQYKTGPPYKFYFRVKFYVSDPCKLADDTTRNYLYQQLRLDIFNNRLVVPTCSAILLASYVLQSEAGDCENELSDKDHFSNYWLLPNQSDDFKKKVIELHKQHKSLSSADAEYNFLEHAAKKLDCYGIQFFDAQDSNKTEVRLGISSNGIILFRNGKKTDQFSWAKILKIMFKKKIFSIQLRREEGINCDNFIEFNLLTNQWCKLFWEECVAQHSFFRLHQPKSPPRKFFSFLNFGSKFQYNGKTEYQTMEESKKRSFSHFSKTPSKRYARITIPIGRPSWNSSNVETKKSELSPDGGNQDDNNKLQIEENNSNQDNRKDANSDYSGIGPVASSSTNSNDSSITSNPISYRPKSLTLRSFMYIDELKSTNEHERNLSSRNGANNDLYTTCKANGGQTSQISERVGAKKELKRCESLRISNPIKGALSLTKKAGVTSSNQLAKLSESLKDKFLAGRSRVPRGKIINGNSSKDINDDLETISETSESRIIRLKPGKDGRYGFKIRKIPSRKSKVHKSKKGKKRSIIIYDVSKNSPAAISDPCLHEGDQILAINGISIEGMSISKVEKMIKSIQNQTPPDLALEVNSRFDLDYESSESFGDEREDSHPPSSPDLKEKNDQATTLADSIRAIKENLETRRLIDDFEKLSRKKEGESLDESRLMENIDKNRYQDILPYDSTRVQLVDSMTGDYINASFVNMPVPSGISNRYIATQGPLATTCDDFWQMIWEQNCSMIIMVTPLVEGGRVKCHKYWPDEKEEVRHGQILVRNLHEKMRAATIDRHLQLIDVKSGEKRITTQVQYKAWPDHEVPADCSDFLKLVNRVRKHRLISPDNPIVVHCSAGIGRTGVLILMETAICIMESGEPIYPTKILDDMRKQRAMLIQTNSQFQFVADAICRVYDQKLYKKLRKNRGR